MFMKYHLLWDRIRPEDRFDAKDRLIVYCTDRIGVDHLALARGRKVEGYSLSFPANFYSAPEGVAFIFKTNFMRLKLDLHDPTALESLHAELDERARRWREQPRARLLPAPVRPVVESQRIERLAA
jgi:hypothetical protein